MGLFTEADLTLGFENFDPTQLVEEKQTSTHHTDQKFPQLLVGLH